MYIILLVSASVLGFYVINPSFLEQCISTVIDYIEKTYRIQSMNQPCCFIRGKKGKQMNKQKLEEENPLQQF